MIAKTRIFERDELDELEKVEEVVKYWESICTALHMDPMQRIAETILNAMLDKIA